MESYSIPTKMEWRVKELKNILKQTIELQPTTGVSTLKGGQQIRVDLPPNSLVDLSTFLMYFNAYCQTGGSAAGGAADYNQARFLPRNSASIIENLEVQINGQSRFNVPNYNYIYNILHDFTQGQDGLNRRCVGENADPSCKYFTADVNIATTATTGVLWAKKGYPIGLVNGASDKDPSQNDYDSYVIRSWLGLLGGNASTQVINTAMFGLITVIITLAPSAITMLGRANTTPVLALNSTGTAATTDKAVPSADAGADYASEAAFFAQSTDANGVAFLTAQRIDNDAEIDIAASGVNGGAVVQAGKDYFLENVKFTIVRYDMPSVYYQATANALASGEIYKLYYPNYSVFTGNPVNSASKAGTMRISISTKSLDCCIGTFRAANFNDNNNDTNSVVLSQLSSPYMDRFGEDKCTFENQVKNGKPVLFNNSKYFVRNGESVKEATWTIGNTRYLTETPQQIFEGVLRHFNLQNDTLGGIHPSIKSIQQFNKYAFAHLLSLNVPEGNDIYNVSGLNSEETPVNIAWEFKADATAFPDDGKWGLVANTVNCIPMVICCYSSHLEIGSGRNIRTIN